MFWLKFGIIVLFLIIQIRGQAINEEQDQGQNQGQNQGQDGTQGTDPTDQNSTNSGINEKDNNIGGNQEGNQNGTGESPQTETTQQQNQQNQEVNTQAAQTPQTPQTPPATPATPALDNVPEAISSQFKYCSHMNYTKIGVDYKLSKNKLVNLFNNRIKKIVKNPTLDLENSLDYHIRYLLLTEGLCYYNDEKVLEKGISQISESFGKFDISGSYTNNGQIYQGYIRYSKTINCYMYYEENLYEDEDNINSFKSGVKLPCLDQCKEYLESIEAFLNNPDLCPIPTDMTYKTIYGDETPLQEVINKMSDARESYKAKVLNFCQTILNDVNNNMKCDDEANIEVVNCGFNYVIEENKEDKEDKDKKETFTSDKKIEFCNEKIPGLSTSCCSYQYSNRNIELRKISYTVLNVSLYPGVSLASLFGILSLYFSIKYIKEIKVQESIKKSIMNQEREYQQANKMMLENAKKNGFNPNDQVYNSSSRNLNSGTLRNTRGNQNGTMTSYASSTSPSNGNSNSTLRYPTNTYTVIQDYISSDERDISIRRGMAVQLIQKYEGGWVMVKDLNTNRQGYAPEYCLGNKLA